MASSESQIFTTLDVEKGRRSSIGHHDVTQQYRTAASPPPEPAPASKVADPGALGLFSFATTTFVISLYNLNTRGIHHNNVVLGMAIFTGGLGQFVAGLWEFPRGNMFGATAFTSYGTFWMSYAMILIPGTGVLAAYGDEAELRSALGIYLLGWGLVTFIMLIPTLRTSLAMILVIGLLGTTFTALAVGELANSTGVTKAGGTIGLITAFGAYYVGLSALLAAEKHPVMKLPLGAFKGE
jgi:hypothetical protein